MLILHAQGYLSLELWNMCSIESMSFGGEERLCVLLEAGANPNILHMGYTALHLATICGPKARPVKWVEIFLEYGAKMDICDMHDHTVLYWAIDGIRWKTGSEKLELVLDRGIDLNVPNGFGDYPLHQMVPVVRRSHPVGAPWIEMAPDPMLMLKRLLAHGTSLELQNKQGYTSLSLACSLRDARATIFLVECGSSLHATTDTGVTPLHIAGSTFQENKQVMRFLLRHGSDANAQSSEGTPLHFAVANRRSLGVIKLLLHHGAGINEENDQKMTPLAKAAIHKFNGRVIGYLLENGAKCDLGTSDVKRRVERAQRLQKISETLKLGR
jgi:ankyrin repeat protein